MICGEREVFGNALLQKLAIQHVFFFFRNSLGLGFRFNTSYLDGRGHVKGGHMGVSKHEGPSYRPPIVGLVL